MINGARNDSIIGMLRMSKAELRRLYNSKKNYWAQRALVCLLREGNKNTRYFHVHASHQHKKNHTKRLRNEVGEWISVERGLCDVMKIYFEGLFFTECNGSFKEILNKI